MLKLAIDHHYCSYPAIDTDPFFNQLRTNQEFKKIRLAGMACHNDFKSDRDKPQITRENGAARDLPEFGSSLNIK